jgi:hypothetical protein
MAVVKIGQVKKTLSKAMAYICNPDKTRGMELVSTNLPGVGKDPGEYADCFIAEQDRIDKGRKGPAGNLVRAHHIIQSFDPGDDITPERAHELGVELMERMTGGMQHYVIATHTDRDHIHNHIMLSPASIETGRRVQVPCTYLKQLRAISDELCRDAGLKVIREHKVKRYGKSRPDLYTQLRGESVKESIRLRIDEAAGRSGSFDQFKRALVVEGVDVRVRGKYLTFQDAETGMMFRDNKLGGAYDEMNIIAKIGRSNVEAISFNTSMIVGRKDGTVTIWVPGTRHTRTLTIPRERLVIDGRTIRAWLPRDSEQILADRGGRFQERIPARALYEYFSPLDLNIDKLVRNDFPQIYSANPKQRKRLMAQAFKVEEINRAVRELNTIREYLIDGGMSSKEAAASLQSAISSRQEDLQTLIVASCEEGLSPEQAKSLDQKINRAERDISDLAGQARALRDRERRINPESTEQQKKQQRPHRSR